MAQAERQKLGQFGENLACKFLKKHGFSVLDRNYRKKWGELDIVAKQKDRLHFVEVKTVTRVTGEKSEYEAEDNVHPWKLKRLSRAVQTWLLEKKILDNTKCQVDVVAIYLDPESKKAKIRYIPNVM